MTQILKLSLLKIKNANIPHHHTTYLLLNFELKVVRQRKLRKM